MDEVGGLGDRTKHEYFREDDLEFGPLFYSERRGLHSESFKDIDIRILGNGCA